MATPGTNPSNVAEVSLRSSPDIRRPATAFMAVFLTLTAILGLLILLRSLALPPAYTPFAIAFIFVGLIILGFVAYYVWRLRNEAGHEYLLELFDDHLRLRIVKPDGRRVEASMSYSNVEFVEYYTVRDRRSLVFHGRDNRIIEVPAWSMQENLGPAFELFSRKQIPVVTL